MERLLERNLTAPRLARDLLGRAAISMTTARSRPPFFLPRGFFALAFHLAILLSSARSVAEPAGPPADLPIRLTVATADCLDAAGFAAQLRRHTSRVREVSGGEPARALRVDLRREGGQFVGGLTVRDVDGNEGHREVSGTDCPSVVASLAFVAAVIVDPAAMLRGADSLSPAQSSRSPLASSSGTAGSVEPSPVGASALGTSAGEPSHSPPESPGTARGTAPFRLSAGGALEVALGLGPGAAVIPRLGVDFEFPHLVRGAQLRVSGGRGLSRSVSTDVGTAQIALSDVRIDTCFDVLRPASFRMGACGVADGVVLGGEGANTAESQSASRLSIELGLALHPRWIVHDSITFGVAVGGLVPLSRYRFYFAPDQTAYRLAAVSGFAELEAGVAFW